MEIDSASYWLGNFQRDFETMCQENEERGVKQSARLENIARQIHDLGGSIETLAESSKPHDIEILQRRMSQLSIAKADVAKENMILKSLHFESRQVRYSSITEAHQKTFNWVFEDLQNIDPSSGHLLEWLTKEDGFFWVSGKPGSGKSTFMKFVVDHPRTLKALSTWSYPKLAVLVSHFFWSAGTPMQKSWHGVLQTLLREIFRQIPDLIELTCIERWLKTTGQLAYETWDIPELRKVLQRVADRNDMPSKFCFFIDGVDEFEGDHLEFCQVLQDLSRSTQLKICVSSRPWNVFEDFFSSASKIYMQKLTQNDIRSYANSRLQEHPRWKELEIEVKNAEWLSDSISQRAAGVFLWVYLVTRLLRNGLTEYDGFSDLQRRLESIPTDL
jgi:NACHT domain